jgi:hypothetical protein
LQISVETQKHFHSNVYAQHSNAYAHQYRCAVAMIRSRKTSQLQPIARLHVTGYFCIIPTLNKIDRRRNSKHKHTRHLRSTQIRMQQLRRDATEHLKGQQQQLEKYSRQLNIRNVT